MGNQGSNSEVAQAKQAIMEIMQNDLLTKSGKMRALLAMGVTRAQVVELMGVSYQFVYQVDKKRLERLAEQESDKADDEQSAAVEA